MMKLKARHAVYSMSRTLQLRSLTTSQNYMTGGMSRVQAESIYKGMNRQFDQGKVECSAHYISSSQCWQTASHAHLSHHDFLPKPLTQILTNYITCKTKKF